MDYQSKKTKLNQRISELAREDVCLAFSGGVDSSLLLYLAGKYAAMQGSQVYGVTFDTELHPTGDLEIAGQIAEYTGAIHSVIHLDELENPEILKNPPNRCYLCKKMLFQKLLAFAQENEIRNVLEGTNADDRTVYRPGLQAVKEAGVSSPLAECGFTKEEVRRYAQECGLDVAERPSTPCLATRLPYGTTITTDVLKKIEKGETFLRNLGFYNVRLRIHEDVARMEVDKQDFYRVVDQQEKIVYELKKIGFPYITMDLEGFRSGSMDELLEEAAKNK